MRIAVLGAGAIGGLIAAKLAHAGADVCVIDRGPHLERIRSAGIELIGPEGGQVVARPARAVASCADAGPHDVVFIALKANLLEDMAGELNALFHGDTAVVTLQNGLPWWYFDGCGGPHEGYRFRTIDRQGLLASAVASKRVVGSVAFPSAEVIAPGVVRHIEGFRFPLGELDGAISARAQRISAVLEAAGFKAPVVRDIRTFIWIKLLGNVSFNPISALTHATLEDLCGEPRSRALAAVMMDEARVIGERLGVRMRVSTEQRVEGGARTGAHKTSTLQDVEAGRRVELDALLGSVVELADLVGVQAPTIRAALAMLELLDKTLQRRRARIELIPAG